MDSLPIQRIATAKTAKIVKGAGNAPLHLQPLRPLRAPA
jgi:hypothetical protein